MPRIFSEEDRNIIKDKMISEAIAQLTTKNYKSISLDDITASVGIAKGTFYNFFSSKEHFFYEVMQQVKEDNRAELYALVEQGRPSREQIYACLSNRYLNKKTVYHYFTMDEMRLILRRIPEGDYKNDSTQFAEELLEKMGIQKENVSEVVVNLFHVLAMTASNSSLLKSKAYEETISVLCHALTDYIYKEMEG
jgi:AcrR family transcriptional regulator